MADLIVLTGASGKQCSTILPFLHAHPDRYRLRLVVHSDQSKARLQQEYSGAQVVQAQLANFDDCVQLVEGATTVYHVGPPLSSNEYQMGKNMVDAAVAEKMKPGSKLAHFVLSSVIHPELSKLLNHDCKRHLEEYLFESGLPYTILQPSHFADNLMGRMVDLKHAEAAEPTFPAAYSTDVPFSFSIHRDTGEASFRVIEGREKHFYATYQLVSTLPITYVQYAEIVGEVIGKKIKLEIAPFMKAVETFFKAGQYREGDVDNPRILDAIERLLLYYNRRGLLGNSAVLEMLLGRKPTTLKELAQIYSERST